MRTSHKHGLDALGAEDIEWHKIDQSVDVSTPDSIVLGVEAATPATPAGASQLGKMFAPGKKKRALIIQINNAAQLAAAAKGEEGVFAANVLPDLVEQQVYQTAGDSILAAMKDKGVDANVKVIDVGSWTLDEDDLGAAKYITYGFAGASVLGLLGYFLLRNKK